MNILDSATICAFQSSRIDEFGSGTPRALGWKSSSSQKVRFDVLAEIADFNKQTVLDVGCGHGDLRGHLGASYPNVRYIGIDHMKDFLDVAFAKFGDWPDTTFYLGDFSTMRLPNVDYVLASGAMSYRNSHPNFVYDMITRMFAVCRMGIGFNLLSSTDSPDGLLVAYEPETVLAHCQTLTPKVVYRGDYLDNDFTVVMHR